ncbi:uncharacterized protein A4U43_C04F9290 [Asparagus officinalis]|uniref:Uncharacterized protein n=1 Tax=Asparagus officinalis TaxID=4686 RepID=A0A5P1F4X1_ASPOF|nr:uncharacterized protein A4U43_C04F9290 [Asparagus officinalis]
MGRIDESSPSKEITTLTVEEDVVDPSTIPKVSRRPGKEPIGVDDGIEGRAETPSDQIENGADRRILEDMPNRLFFGPARRRDNTTGGLTLAFKRTEPKHCLGSRSLIFSCSWHLSPRGLAGRQEKAGHFPSLHLDILGTLKGDSREPNPNTSWAVGH